MRTLCRELCPTLSPPLNCERFKSKNQDFLVLIPPFLALELCPRDVVKEQSQGVDSPSYSRSPASGLCIKTKLVLFRARIDNIARSRKLPKGPSFRSPRLEAQCGNAPKNPTNGFCYVRACKPLEIPKRACLHSIAEPTLKSPGK